MTDPMMTKTALLMLGWFITGFCAGRYLFPKRTSYDKWKNPRHFHDL